jgi:hypothetical protein
MSSLNSSAVPADSGEATIVDAFVRVAEVSYCAYAEPCDAARLIELEEQWAEMGGGPAEWFRVAVHFTGDCFGHMVLHVPCDVARDLVASFMGMMPDEAIGDELVADAIGEFGNMVCGAWLTDAATRLNFALKPPQVTRENADWRPVESLAADDGEGTAYGMALNERPALLRVRLEALL